MIADQIRDAMTEVREAMDSLDGTQYELMGAAHASLEVARTLVYEVNSMQLAKFFKALD